MRKTHLIAALCSVLVPISVLVSACGTLPRATIDASRDLEKLLQSFEKNHLKLIDKFFETKQAEALSMLDREWYPRYLDNFFAHEKSEAAWNEIIQEPDKTERIAGLQEIVSIIQTEYMRERDTYILPLEQSRLRARAAVQEEYAKARELNRGIFSSVASVHEIQEMRRDFLSEVAGLDVDAIDHTVDEFVKEADEVLDKVVKAVQKIEQAAPKVEAVIGKLN